MSILEKTIDQFIDHNLYDKKSILCEIMNACGSDKGSGPPGHHNYTNFYHCMFESIRQNVKYVFEMGLGTRNTKIPSNMGINGTPCASVRGWKSYFTNAHIMGADIDRDILVQEDRISTYYCDQTNASSIKEMWSTISQKMDIIIDDGLHEPHANRNFYENSIDKLMDGGIYIIEDVRNEHFIELESFFKNELFCEKFKMIKMIKIPNPKNRADNNLIVIQK